MGASRLMSLLLGAALIAAPMEGALADPPGRGERERERRREGPARAERPDHPAPRFAPREASPGRSLNPERQRPQQAGDDRRRDDRERARRRDDDRNRNHWRGHDDDRRRHAAPHRPPAFHYHPPPRPPVYVVRPPTYVVPPPAYVYAPPPRPIYVAPSPPPVVYGPEVVHAAPAVGYGIAEGTCHRGAVGALVGAGTGAFVGNQAGNGGVGATIAGGILGALVGGLIGNAMDQVDHTCVGQVLEQARTNQTVTWVGANAGESYTVQPTRTWQLPDGRPCREYTTTAVIGGEAAQAFGTACRNPDGSWQIVN